MSKLQVEGLDKGALICFTHDLVFTPDTNVLLQKKMVSVVRGEEPSVHNLTLLITDEVWLNPGKEKELISRIKFSYGENLIALLDEDGNKI